MYEITLRSQKVDFDLDNKWSQYTEKIEKRSYKYCILESYVVNLDKLHLT